MSWGRAVRGVRCAGFLALGLVSGLSVVACGGENPERGAPEAVGSSSPPPVQPPADLPLPTTRFGQLIDRLSEPGGFFPSDNLVSNETSYLHVLGIMDELNVRGGAYIGVGPDQNFSYIAHVRPTIAFIIDIRRDNLLHHLLFKSLFENARNRLEFLALMLGRPTPEPLEAWDSASIDEIVVYLDTTAADIEYFEAAHERIAASIREYGYPLSAADLGTIRGIHSIFYDYGLDIRYSNRGRGPTMRFPTWRLLMLQTDLNGERRSYLASEERFRFVQDLQRRNRVVPVVGDLAGPHALAAIGQEIERLGLRISAFYVSNVEQYLMRGPEFDRFAETVTGLPYDDRSVLIRSYFARRWPIPQTVPGHMSAQLLERFTDFVREFEAGGYRTYTDLVTKNVLPRAPTAIAVPSS